MRNSQASVLAPTGTIGLMMDCDTTGIEPDLGLCKIKKLVGGGTMTIVNQTIPRALHRLGYSDDQIVDIVAYIDENKTILGAPHLAADHVEVFACSMGDNAIHYLGHVKMMGAVQPFISGAISKTVNMPEDVTIEDVEQLHIDAWKLGVKAVAIYRDNCKVAQPLAMAKKDGVEDAEDAAAAAAAAGPAVVTEVVERIVEKIVKVPVREKLPRSRTSRTFEFRVADCKGFVTVGEYDDGRPGEVFLRVSKQGSTLAGIMDAFAISVSHGLQYGVPLRSFVEAFTNMRFEPAGMTDDPEIRFASSLLDYIFRRLAVDYLSFEERAELDILTIAERTPAHAARCRGDGHGQRAGPGHGRRPAVDRVGCRAGRPARDRDRPEQPGPAVAARQGRGHRPPPGEAQPGDPAATRQPRRRPVLHAVRRPDAAGRFLSRLPQLRQHQRLQLI